VAARLPTHTRRAAQTVEKLLNDYSSVERQRRTESFNCDVKSRKSLSYVIGNDRDATRCSATGTLPGRAGPAPTLRYFHLALRHLAATPSPLELA